MSDEIAEDGTMLISHVSEPRAYNAISELERAAKELESSFLSEMLRGIGAADSRDDLSGGPGEEQFSSLLRSEYARVIVDNGGIGFAQSIVTALARRGTSVG